MIEQFYTVQEIAAKLSCHEETVRRMCANKALDAIRVGTGLRISESSYLAYTKGGGNVVKFKRRAS
jgi:excisionase family DNA binding protein